MGGDQTDRSLTRLPVRDVGGEQYRLAVNLLEVGPLRQLLGSQDVGKLVKVRSGPDLPAFRGIW